MEIIFGIIAVVALMCSVLLAKEVVNLKEIIDSLREDVESLNQANIDISQKSQGRYLEQVQHITEMDNYLEEKLGKDASAIDEIFTATKGFDIRLKRVEGRVGEVYSDFRKTATAEEVGDYVDKMYSMPNEEMIKSVTAEFINGLNDESHIETSN